MKTLYILFLSLILSATSFAQDCVDYSKITDPGGWADYRTEIYNEDGIVIRTGQFFNIFSLTPTGISFNGFMDVDVSSGSCGSQTVEFSSFIDYVAIDQDTVELYADGRIFPIYGLGYQINLDLTTDLFKVTGHFDEITIGGYGTSILEDFCVTNHCLDVSTKNATSLKNQIYPNPTYNILNVNADFETLEIVNLLGASVLTAGNQSKTIDVSGLATGTYFVKFTNNGQSSVTRFIKK